MPRTSISSAALQAMFAEETDEVFLLLVEISHPELPNPLRITSDAVSTISRGETYVSFPFSIQLPGDEEDAPPLGRAAIDNVNRELANAIRSVLTPALMTIDVVRGDAPDDVLVTFPKFKLRNVRGSVSQLTGELILDDLTRESYPGRSFTATDFPGLIQ